MATSPKKPAAKSATKPSAAPSAGFRWSPRLRGWVQPLVRWGLRLSLGLFLFSVVQVASARFVTPLFTLTMIDQIFAQHEETGEWALPRYRRMDLDELGAHLPRMAVASEDGWFWHHDGFDWHAIVGALESNREGGSLRGGSTISQQVARNVFLWQERSWVRKGLETYYTFLLELLVPKERILELYLNVAEMGPLTFGGEAAAQRWYKKSAKSLTEDEAARIIAVLPAPRSRDPRSGEMGKRARRIRDHKVPFPGDKGFEAMGEEMPRLLAREEEEAKTKAKK
jgi:monofunctional biosynthetic peptidoglycan transglycosylase